MFYLLWALKNIYRNKKRTIEIVLFIIIISMMFFLNFAFLNGSQRQMKETLRSFLGDITLDAKGEDFNLSKVKEHLRSSENKNVIKMIIDEYSFGNARVISDDGYLSNSYVKGFSSNYFKQLDKSVEWIEGGAFFANSNQAVIERTMAEYLSVSVGDKVTLEFKTPEGAINTTAYEISGIFIGNKYIHQNSLYVSLVSARNLGLVENNYSNHLKIFLINPYDDVSLRKIVNNDLNLFSGISYINVWKWASSDILFLKIFQFSRIFFKILITLISVVLLIVLFFGIQNSFYLNFTKRANEISVLTTFGMPFVKIYKTVFWETCFLFLTGLALGFLLALFVGKILTGISLAQLSDEMVIVLGGPNLQFGFMLKTVLWVVFFIFISGLYASFHSLRKYFKLEVREMKRGI